MEVEFLGVEVVGGELGVPGVVRGRKDVGDPLVSHVPVLPLDEIIETGISLVLVDGVGNYIVHLVMGSRIGVVVIIVDFELLVGVFDQSESVAFNTAYADVY